MIRHYKNDNHRWIEIEDYEALNFINLLICYDDGEREYFRGIVNHGLVTISNEYYWNGNVLL